MQWLLCFKQPYKNAWLWQARASLHNDVSCAKGGELDTNAKLDNILLPTLSSEPVN